MIIYIHIHIYIACVMYVSKKNVSETLSFTAPRRDPGRPCLAENPQTSMEAPGPGMSLKSEEKTHENPMKIPENPMKIPLNPNKIPLNPMKPP